MKCKVTMSAKNLHRKCLDIPLLEGIGFVFMPKYGCDNYVKPTPECVEIEMTSIEELKEFCNKFGEIIFNGTTIETYNEYYR